MASKGKTTRNPGPFGEWREIQNPDGSVRISPALTEEGQRLLVAWLKDYPDPAKLFAKVFRKDYNRCMALGIDHEELNTAAMLGITSAMFSWDPELSTFSTFAAWSIRQAVQNHIDQYRDFNKRQEWGVVVVADEQHGEDENSILNGLAARSEEPSMSEIGADIRAALKAYVPEKRDRDMFTMYYGLDDGIPRTLCEVARHYGLTRERVRQLVLRTKRTIYDDLFGIYRKHIEA